MNTQGTKIENENLPNLTLKQEGALQHFLKNGNKSEAYRHAYNTGKMKAETINRKAVELFDNGKVTAWVEHYQKQRSSEFNIEMDAVLKTLATVMSKGLKSKRDKYNDAVPTDLSSVVSALRELCKIKGYYAPVDNNLNINTPLTAIQINTNDPIEAAKMYEKIMKGG